VKYLEGRQQSGTALVEFALAWPIVLLLVLGSVELAVWESEAAAARYAALAGARAGTAAGAGAVVASAVSLRAISASLVGTRASSWCPIDARPAPAVWVCATDTGVDVQVDVGGSVPSLVPLVAGGGLPLRAHVQLRKETFVR
jgi:Flp pilus assembly protein TadG